MLSAPPTDTTPSPIVRRLQLETEASVAASRALAWTEKVTAAALHGSTLKDRRFGGEMRCLHG